jgi:tRNA threonylcarbamoyladenosine biosynthesis protein TsaE
VETSDSRQTEALGAELAARLNEGDVVLVIGELGAGKTTFVRGAAQALGVIDPITSPTFSIGHRYRGKHVTVTHLDMYRLGGLQAEEPDLLDDYLGPGRIAFVEWPEQTAPELRHARVHVTITHLGEERRQVELCEHPTCPPGAPLDMSMRDLPNKLVSGVRDQRGAHDRREVCDERGIRDERGESDD